MVNITIDCKTPFLLLRKCGLGKEFRGGTAQRLAELTQFVIRGSPRLAKLATSAERTCLRTVELAIFGGGTLAAQLS